jgi:regulator of replication initiation timing
MAQPENSKVEQGNKKERLRQNVHESFEELRQQTLEAMRSVDDRYQRLRTMLELNKKIGSAEREVLSSDTTQDERITREELQAAMKEAKIPDNLARIYLQKLGISQENGASTTWKKAETHSETLAGKNPEQVLDEALAFGKRLETYDRAFNGVRENPIKDFSELMALNPKDDLEHAEALLQAIKKIPEGTFDKVSWQSNFCIAPTSIEMMRDRANEAIRMRQTSEYCDAVIERALGTGEKLKEYDRAVTRATEAPLYDVSVAMTLPAERDAQVVKEVLAAVQDLPSEARQGRYIIFLSDPVSLRKLQTKIEEVKIIKKLHGSE